MHVPRGSVVLHPPSQATVSGEVKFQFTAQEPQLRVITCSHFAGADSEIWSSLTTGLDARNCCAGGTSTVVSKVVEGRRGSSRRVRVRCKNEGAPLSPRSGNGEKHGKGFILIRYPYFPDSIGDCALTGKTVSLPLWRGAEGNCLGTAALRSRE